MPQLILDLSQATLDALNQIAASAKDSRFTNAKGMLELRARREVRELLIAKAVEDARAVAETRYREAGV